MSQVVLSGWIQYFVCPLHLPFTLYWAQSWTGCRRNLRAGWEQERHCQTDVTTFIKCCFTWASSGCRWVRPRAALRPEGTTRGEQGDHVPLSKLQESYVFFNLSASILRLSWALNEPWCAKCRPTMSRSVCFSFKCPYLKWLDNESSILEYGGFFLPIALSGDFVMHFNYCILWNGFVKWCIWKLQHLTGFTGALAFHLVYTKLVLLVHE